MGKKADRLLSTKEAMEILGVDWNAIYGYIFEGKLKARKLGGNGDSKRHWRIWHSDLIAFIDGDEEESHTESLNKNKKSVVENSSSSP